MHDERFVRQSFLGSDSERILENIHVGIVGLGGGGSHIAQQLAHIGVANYSLFDFDKVSLSNLNRLIGATVFDVGKTLKVEVAKRRIKELIRYAFIRAIPKDWRDAYSEFVECDIIFSCVDTLQIRAEIEAACRSAFMPMIDVGMDIYEVENGYTLAGQVILSMPGHACLRCMRYLTDDNLAREAKRYGQTGARPQVVWPNGVLTSTAVGVFVDLVTDWTRNLREPAYLAYDGKRGLLMDDPARQYFPTACLHYPLLNAGTPIFKPL